MRKFTLRLLFLNLIFISPVFAGEIIRQEIPTFTDQDLEKYSKPQDNNSSAQRQTGRHENNNESNEINESNADKTTISYEAAISNCGLTRQSANMKLATFLYIPERDAIFVNDKSLREACERMNKEGEKCYMAKPLPITETKYVLGEFCHIMKKGGADDFKMDGYSVKISHHDTRDKTMHQIIVQFEKFNDTTLLVRRITYDDGRTFEGEAAGFMLLWFFHPSAI